MHVGLNTEQQMYSTQNLTKTHLMRNPQNFKSIFEWEDD